MNEFSLPQFSRELQEHLDAHPLAQPGDLVKYCRQRVFSASRTYSGEQEALQALAGEYATLSPGDTAPLLEPLGSGVVRLNLAGTAASGLSPAQLARACVLDSSLPRREEVQFREEWIPMERLYQEHFQIRRQADLIVE